MVGQSITALGGKENPSYEDREKLATSNAWPGGAWITGVEISGVHEAYCNTLLSLGNTFSNTDVSPSRLIRCIIGQRKLRHDKSIY